MPVFSPRQALLGVQKVRENTEMGTYEMIPCKPRISFWVGESIYSTSSVQNDEYALIVIFFSGQEVCYSVDKQEHTQGFFECSILMW